MNDAEIEAEWAALDPTPGQRRRIEGRVRNWLDARQTSLAAEWLGLLKASPLAGLGFAVVAACLMLFATPLNWVAFAML